MGDKFIAEVEWRGHKVKVDQDGNKIEVLCKGCGKPMEKNHSEVYGEMWTCWGCYFKNY